MWLVVFDVVEFFLGEVSEFVGVVVVVGECVVEIFGWEFIDGYGVFVGEVVVVGF